MAAVYLVLHYVLMTAYIAAPIVAIIRSLRNRGNNGPALATLGTFAAGTAMGISLSVVYAIAVKGGVSISQAILASYFATALMILLRALDAALRAVTWRMSVRHEIGADGITPLVSVRPRAALIGNVVRVLLLFGVGLPFVMSAVVTYRPKVRLNDDPMTQLGFYFEPVEFEATDGVRISGWFLPAQVGTRQIKSAKTVILCHGLGSNKANQLVLSRRLIPAGYNVLAIDLRAHGQSGGQLSSFGDLERRDVLGAVRFLQRNRPAVAQRIFGVGASQGAAAIIAAAAGDSPEAQSIEAIAVYGTYDDLGGLVKSLSKKTFLPPFNWILDQIALPVASAHVGADLAGFKPAELVKQVWPRPILVIHGVQDQIIDFSHGKRLYENADFPKEFDWISRGDHNSIVNSDEAAAAVLYFFETARTEAVI